MRLRAWTAASTSVARRSSVCARNPSPVTCFHLPMAVAWCTDRLVGAEELSGVGGRPFYCPLILAVPFKLNQDRRHHIPRVVRPDVETAGCAVQAAKGR